MRPIQYITCFLLAIHALIPLLFWLNHFDNRRHDTLPIHTELPVVMLVMHVESPLNVLLKPMKLFLQLNQYLDVLLHSWKSIKGKWLLADFIFLLRNILHWAFPVEVVGLLLMQPTNTQLSLKLSVAILCYKRSVIFTIGDAQYIQNTILPRSVEGLKI